MIHAQEVKYLEVIAPQAIKDDASWTTSQIDTLGFDYCTVLVHIGATDIAMAALKIQESDTDGSNFSDVTGLIYGTSTNTDGSTSTLPAADADNTFAVFQIDLRGRKRYLDLVATAGDGTSGTYASAVAILERAKDGPAGDATSQGAGQILRI